MRVSIHCRFLATRPAAGSLDTLEAAATTARQARFVVGAKHPRSGSSKLGSSPAAAVAHVDAGWHLGFQCAG